jgi:hypothetical protein
MRSSLLRNLSIGALLVVVCFSESLAYSVLTHEAVIDAAWTDSIEPVLLRRFPHATPQELLQAHAYAFGGAIIQDLGYYPFGDPFFTDLTHYVRSGDFVLALLEESRDLNEYAFALGALSHYAADMSGHPLATNRAVAIMYPKLAKKYGAIVPYEAKPSAHLKIEFGFDVDQVAEGNYAPKAYHDFIGFEVSESLLERAFKKTYSLDMSTVFARVNLTLGSYRDAHKPTRRQYQYSKLLKQLPSSLVGREFDPTLLNKLPTTSTLRRTRRVPHLRVCGADIQRTCVLGSWRSRQPR